jgi:mRNA interferase RelE/StbE
MTRRIVWQPSAIKDLQKLDAKMRERVVVAVERLAEADFGDVRRLSGFDDEWRLRVGKWRVRFTYRFDPPSIHILRVLPRGEAYRK